ncbi:MAG: tetratricopeptide repeat protein [Thermoanaerobaculia bacterium]
MLGFKPLTLPALLLLALPFPARAATPDGKAAYPFLLAGALLADGDSEAALKAYADAAALAPEDPFVHLEFANVLMRAGRSTDAAAEAKIARRLAPMEIEVIRTEGRIAMSLADHDTAAGVEAVQAFEALLVAEPDDLESLVALGQLYLGSSDAKRAVEKLNRAAELRPGQPMIEALRARALAETGDLAAAESVQRSLLEASPDRLDNRLDLAELLSNRGQHREAAELLAAAPEAQQRSPEVRRRRAVELYLDGDLVAAGTIARGLFADFPDNISVRVLLATIEQADGHWSRVLELIGALADSTPVHDQLSFLDVRALERLGRVEEALAALSRRQVALSDAGRREDAIQTLASTALLAARNDRGEAALALAAQVLASTPAPDPELAIQMRLLSADIESERKAPQRAAAVLGAFDVGGVPENAALTGKRYELAARAGNSAEVARWRKTLEGRGIEGLYALASAEDSLGHFEAALPVIQKALALRPESAELRFQQATTLERAGKFEAATKAFEAILASEPENAAALNYLGYMRIERGVEVAAGLAMVTRALALDANNGAYLDSVGWGLFRLGRLAEATETLERAARLMPNDRTVLEHLGDSCRALGALDRARDAYRRALALGPDIDGGLAAKLAGLPGAS